MSTICQTQRDLMVEYIAAELPGLKAARLQAHLEGCEACAEVHAQLCGGLQAARDFEPAITEAELDRRATRLAAFVTPEPRPARFEFGGFWGWAVGGATACAMALAMLSVQTSQPDTAGSVAEAPRSTMQTPKLAVAPKLVVPSPVAGPVQHHQLTKHLRAVSSPDWNGRVKTAQGVTEVEMDAGFAVLDFEGGQKRILRVKAPNVSVRVLGTRFFVEARSGVATKVGVVAGRVEVTAGDQIEVLAAGQTRAYEATRAFTPELRQVQSALHHSDGFLTRPPAEPPKPPKAKPKRARKLAKPKAVDPVLALTKAEGLVRSGQIDEGLAVYEVVLRTRPLPAIRDLVKYEQARVWGFVQKDRARAERAFITLSRTAVPEVRRQAALAQCELALKDDACRARLCLEALSEGSNKSVTKEAQVLLRTWNVTDATCTVVHKNAAP